VNKIPAIVEHGENRQARFLRARRLQIALGVAAVEGILVLAGSIPWWAVVAAAVVAVGVRWAARDVRRSEVRHATWILAVSQLIVVLVPAAAALLTALAIVTLVLVAALALFLLLRDRG
jgi:hypothetical protein